MAKPVPEWMIEGAGPLVDPIPHRYGEIVRECVDSLKPQDRYAVEMYFYERISLAEMAHRLGLKGRQSAAYRLGRALGHLEECLKERGITELLFSRDDVEDDYGEL